MSTADGRSIRLALRILLDGTDGEECAHRIAEYVIERAIAGHFGFFKLVLDTVDGKLHKTADTEATFETDCVIVVADDGRDVRTSKAA